MKKTLHSLLSLVLAVVMLAGLVCSGGAFPLLTTAAEEPEYYILDTCDAKVNFANSGMRDMTEKKQGKASLLFNGSGSWTIVNNVSYGLDVPENLGGWYLELWLYVESASNLTRAQCKLEMASSDSSYYSWSLNNVSIRTGWNKIRVQTGTAYSQGKDDFTQINTIRLVMNTKKTMSVRVDDICLSRSLTASDKSVLQAAVDKAADFDTTGGSAATVAKFEAAKVRAEQALADETCSQREADVSAEVLDDAMNAFGFEGFTVDDSTEYGFIDFNTMTYSTMDGFRVVGGQLEDYNERHGASFNDQLLINAAKKYVVSGTTDVRFTITYYDGTEGGLELRYTSTEGEKTALTIDYAGYEIWRTVTVRVADAALARAFDNYDFTLKATGNATAYVARVEVKVIDESDLSEAPVPEFAEQTEANNIIGAGTCGYQMWFSAGDSWVHWGEGSHPNPAPGNGNYSFDVYPYVQDYIDNGATLHESDLGKLGDGSQSVLFSSKDPEIVETHFQWISEYGIDCMAIQRFGFGSGGAKIEDENNHLILARDMAEKYNKAIYVMYDVSGQGELSSDEFFQRMTNDWVQNVEQSGVVSSTAYAHADGKPVVCIWGISGDAGTEEKPQTNYPKGETVSRIVNWFHERGYYVIIGTPDNSYTTRTGVYLEPFTLADMISPWTVGRYAYNSCVKWIRESGAKDVAFCEKYDLVYQPVVFPGFSWIGMLHGGRPNAYPRMAGEFIWRQVVEYKALGVNSLYFAMFDEYDEGTAYMKGATDYFEIPTAQYFVTYAVDGQWLSNDYYLRVAQRAIEYVNDETGADEALGIAHSQGPIYWRNSFEKRWTTWIQEVGDSDWSGDTEQPDIQNTILMNVDVCAPAAKALRSYGVIFDKKVYVGQTDFVTAEGTTDIDEYGTSREGTGIFRDAKGTYTKSGEWAFQLNGEATVADADGSYLLADTDIMVSAAGLELTYSIYAVNENGRNVYVDLVMDDNTRLSAAVPELANKVMATGRWLTVTVKLPSSLVGRRIKGVAVSYTGGEGFFDAYVDDVIIQSPGDESAMLQTAINTASALEMESEALDAAIESGKAVLNSDSAKEKLAAMKAIDAVLREEVVLSTAQLGDVNGDGSINTTDARLVLQYAVGKVGDADLDVSVADVNGDGQVNTTDARLILQYAVGKISSFA